MCECSCTLKTTPAALKVAPYSFNLVENVIETVLPLRPQTKRPPTTEVMGSSPVSNN